MNDLLPLPGQPDGVPWPTTAWPTAEPSSPAVVEAVDRLVSDADRFGQTYACAVIERGHLVHEVYAGELEHWDRPDEPVESTTRLLSWSMAKSVTHAAVGIALGDGLLDLGAPAPVPEWIDERSAITLDHLLCMRDGLEFWEDYDHGLEAHVVEMLFGEGQADVAGFAASRPLAHEPGTTFNYSSGTTNIVCRILGEAVGTGAADTAAFLRSRLFDPIGMTSAEPRFDEAGTFIGSSYLYATARDFARFGLLYLRGGVWDGARLLPEGWVDHGRRPRSVDPDDGRLHGAHWWVIGDDHGSFWASGYDGQSITLVPTADAIVVRLGKTPNTLSDNVYEWRLGMIDLLTGGI